MSRQTNIRTMEKRIYDLEKGGGGSGSSVKWSDVTYKPFKTLDSNDFVVESDKLKLKNGGGGGVSTPILSIANTTEVYTHTNNKNEMNVLNIYDTGTDIKIMGAWHIVMDTTDISDSVITELSTTEIEAIIENISSISDAIISDATHTAIWDDENKRFDCKWEDSNGYGNSYIYPSRFISDEYNNSIRISSNYDTIFNLVI